MEEIESHDTFYLTRAGFIVPTVTGSISCISSATIIYIIVKSMRNTVYHRLLFVISFCDMLSSLAVALTTLPMPTDVIYSFEGPSYGNTKTCEAQGLVYATGNAIIINVSIILYIYYLAALRMKMPDHKFSKRIEPVLLSLAITMPLVLVPLLAMRNKVVNPSPYVSFCFISSYPLHCNDPRYEDEQCIRGEGGTKMFQYLLFACSFLVVTTLLISMALIIHFFWGIERAKKRREMRSTDILSTDPEDFLTDEDYELTNLMTKQALMYFGAFLLTWSWTLLNFWKGWDKHGYVKYTIGDNCLFQTMFTIFHPLQGFYNLVIFFYHKIWSLRRKSDIGAFEALILTFRSPGDVPLERVTNMTHVNAIQLIELSNEKESSHKLSGEGKRRNPTVDSDDLSFDPSMVSLPSMLSAFASSDLSLEPSRDSSRSKMSGFVSNMSEIKEND